LNQPAAFERGYFPGTMKITKLLKPNYSHPSLISVIAPMLFFAGMLVYSLMLSPWGHDVPHHMFKLGDLYGMFAQGNYHNALSERLARGLGLPAYVFYSQWVFLLPYLLMSFGISMISSLAITSVFLMAVAYSGFYCLARLHVGQRLATIGAVLFISSNYVLGEVFTRFAYSEFFAYAFLPFFLYALHRALLDTGIRYVFVAIALGTLLVLAHPLSFINSIPLMAFYCFSIFAIAKSPMKFFVRGILLSLFVVSLSCFFWLPGLIEKEFVQGAAALNIHYSRTFLNFELVFLKPLYWLNLGLALSACLLVAMGVHMVSVWRLAQRDKQGNKQSDKSLSKIKQIPQRYLNLLLCILLYIFLCLPISSFIWESSSILQANQFVTRVLFPLSIAASLYVVIIYNQISRVQSRDKSKEGNSFSISQLVLKILTLALIVYAASFIHAYTKDQFSIDNWQQVFPRTSMQEHVDDRLASYSKRQKGWGISEYLPKTDDSSLLVSRSECTVDVNASRIRSDGDNRSFDYRVANNDCYLRLARYWHPRYQAYDHKGDQLAVAHSDSGGIRIKPSKPFGRIELVFTEPAYVAISKRLSFYSLIVLVISALFAVIWQYLRARKN